MTDAVSVDLRRWALGDAVAGYALVGSIDLDRRFVPEITVGLPLPYLAVDTGALAGRIVPSGGDRG